jgi:hypothetical protein
MARSLSNFLSTLYALFLCAVVLFLFVYSVYRAIRHGETGLLVIAIPIPVVIGLGILFRWLHNKFWFG